MKTKLLSLLSLGIFTLLTIQNAEAQYSGVAYNGNIPQAGTVVGEGGTVTIEMENYDALSGDATGVGGNFGAADDYNTLPPGGTYYDSTTGGNGSQSIRSGSDVDIVAGGTGNVITDVATNENWVYTINVVTAGTYHLNVNYTHNGSSKNIKVYSYNVNGGSKTLLYDGLSEELPSTGINVYALSSNLGSFDLPAGPRLIKFRSLDAGPKFDYFTLTLDSASSLSTNDFDSSSIYITNPVKNELVIDGLKSNVKDVSVFNMLGKSVLQSRVNEQSSSLSFDVSNLSSGIYIVKMSGESGSFTKKFVKQ